MKAIVIGATGATGKDLVEQLLDDDKYKQVDIFVRKSPDIDNPKLKIHKVDFDNIDEWKHLIKADVAFSCMGTTIKDAGSKAMQWKVDYVYQYEFAEMAKQNNTACFILVSSAFASSKSLFFYAKMKGKLEEEIKNMNFEKYIIFNPPALIRENTNRTNELRGIKFIKALNRLGLFKSQRPLKTYDLAKAILNAVDKLKVGVHRIKANQIEKFI
ncbi:MAG: NAD(P)H-binding protein [Marinifilaceae bacterium]|jgi:uncharacterized protein YbjT (DUF2867 family)|nr:NAD(P)H-binding protein [Marinifilaceae bacterium]